MREGSEEKGLLWKLPQVNSKQLGKLGPAFGFGAGCGLGLGIGLLGGTILFLLPFAHKPLFLNIYNSIITCEALGHDAIARSNCDDCLPL
jgi:hypothetical protein